MAETQRGQELGVHRAKVVLDRITLQVEMVHLVLVVIVQYQKPMAKAAIVTVPV